MTFNILPPVLILGMHRSGTSCLAGTMQNFGLYSGDVNEKAGFNKKGNRENTAFVNLHDGILSRVISAWDDPPKNQPIWLKEELVSRNNLAIALSNEASKLGTRWGIKDPRLLFLLEGWKDLNPEYIGTFRHPSSVVQSLTLRARAWGHELDSLRAYELWRVYNEKLIDLWGSSPFPLLRYDGDENRYRRRCKSISISLGMSGKEQSEFRSRDLEHYEKNEDVPLELIPLWLKLLDAESGTLL